MAGIRRTRVNPLGSILLGGNQPTLATSGRFWTPASMTTALWLDAADSATITLSGSAVTQWNDKSGNGRNVAQGTAGVQPFVTAGALAGRQVVEFAGDYLTSSSAASTWVFLNSLRSSVIAVAKFGTVSNPAATYGLLGTSGTSSASVGAAIYYSDVPTDNDAMLADVSRGVGGAFNVSTVNQNVITANTALLVSVENDPLIGTAASRSTLRVNGIAQIQTNAATGGASGANPTYTLQIGACGNNVVPLTGYIAELLVTSGEISPENQRRAEGYLAHKWGLTANLPAAHPYKVYAPVL